MNTATFAKLKIFLFLLFLGGTIALAIAAGEIFRTLIIASLLAYILEPLASNLESRGLSRTAATTLIFLGIVAIIILFIFLLLPTITHEIKTIEGSFSREQAKEFLEKIEGFIEAKFGFLGFQQIDLLGSFQNVFSSIGNKFFGYLLNVVGLISNLIIIPFIIFFLIRDGRKLKREFVRLVPNRYFEFTLNVLYKMDLQLGNYLRGIFLDALLVGILSIIALRILDVKLFFLIGAFAGFANIIPYIGPIAGAIPAIVISVLHTGDFSYVLYISIAFALVQVIDNVVLQPLVLARSVNMHPLLVLLLVIIGGKFFGVLGMLLSVPVTAVLKVILSESITNFRKYRFI